jgi:hypothetical protein
MSCEYTKPEIMNRKTDPEMYFNTHFDEKYKDSCGKQQSGSLNDVNSCNNIFETLLKRNQDDNNEYHKNMSEYRKELEEIKRIIHKNDNTQLVTKNRVNNSVQRSKDISMKYTVFLGGIIVLLIVETGVLLFV